MKVKQIIYPLPSVITSITPEVFSQSVVRQGESTFVLPGSKVIVLGSLILKLHDQPYDLELWLWCSYTKDQYLNKTVVNEEHYIIRGKLETLIQNSNHQVVLNYDGSNESVEHPKIELLPSDIELYEFSVSGATLNRIKTYLAKAIETKTPPIQ